MNPYSQDLREKVMALVGQAKQPNRQIAEMLGIGEATIERWTRRLRQTGSVAAAAHAGGVARVLASHEKFLREAVKAQPDISLEELRVRIKTELKLNVSGSMVSRELTKLCLPKKKSLHDSERETERVKALRISYAQRMQEVLAPVAHKLHFIDEIGTHLGLTRLCGPEKPGVASTTRSPGAARPHSQRGPRGNTTTTAQTFFCFSIRFVLVLGWGLVRRDLNEADSIQIDAESGQSFC